MSTPNTPRTPAQSAIVRALDTAWPSHSVFASTPCAQLLYWHDCGKPRLSVERMTPAGWLEIGRYDAADEEQRDYAYTAYWALVAAQDKAEASAFDERCAARALDDLVAA